MTHNTEVEEVVEYIGDLLQTGEYRKAVTTLHHQLQKARQEWLREEIERLEGMKKLVKEPCSDSYNMRDWGNKCFNQAIQTIQDRYQAELDQDKQEDHLPDRPLNYERE